jgi:hypothetical protein
MNYTEIEIKIIKQKALDRGRMQGVIITLLICVIALIIIV